MSGKALKIIPLEEVAKHKTESDLWMILWGKVYDITKFVDEHPGGADTLLDCAGVDGTVEFEAVGHSDSAKNMLPKYLIGELSEEDKAKASAGKKLTHGTQGSNLAIAVVVVLIGVILFLIFKQ